MIDRWIVDNRPSARDPIYTRANAGEVYPDPVSPMSATVQFLAAVDAQVAARPDLTALRDDELVAPITDPAWTPLFVPACAVVVDVGVQVSHAVIVSRELGIPCVVSARDATKRIPDGAMVKVGGTHGTVEVLEP